MQKRIFTQNQDSTKTDKAGRVIGYVGIINVWPGTENEFWVKVQSTRNGTSFGASQSQRKFADLGEAKVFIEKTMVERLAKI